MHSTRKPNTAPAPISLDKFGDILSPTEAFRVLGIGKNLGYAALRDGHIPATRLGKRILISKAALKKMLHGT